MATRMDIPQLALIAGRERTPSPARNGLVSIIVPLLDERETLEPLYQQVRAAMDRTSLAWELVYVDDGSTDGSYAELIRLHDAHPHVRVIRLRRNFGKATALAAGIEASSGEIVVTIDADLQDDPAEISRLIAKLDDGYDLVVGWKRDRKDSRLRRVVSHVYNAATRVATGVRLHDMNCGLKVYRREVLDHVQLYGERHRFVPVLAHHLGFSVTEVPVNHRPRSSGRSRFGLERYLRSPFDLMTIVFMGRYRSRPLHLFGGVGVLLGLSGFAILVYLTMIKIGGAHIGGRPLLLLGVLLIVVGIQLLSLGLLGEMLAGQREETGAGTAASRAYVRDILR